MDPLAKNLNKILEDTILDSVLSFYGKRLFFPEGIVFQAQEAQRYGQRINASAGIAALDKKPLLLKTVEQSIRKLTKSQIADYSATGGIDALRQKWKEHLLEKNFLLSGENCSLPIVCNGITGSIAMASALFTDANDPVICSGPCWDNYELIFQTKAKADWQTFSFFTSNGSFNLDGLKKAIQSISSDKKIILLFNFPNNPTGYSLSAEEAAKLCSFLADSARNRKIVVLLDDAYTGFFYESSVYPYSLFNLLHNLHENILVVKSDGVSKEYYAWGLRIGFCTIAAKGLTKEHYEAVGKKMLGFIRAEYSSCNTLSQNLMLQTLSSPRVSKELEHYHKLLYQRYRTIKKILSQNAYRELQTLPFNSGYFFCLNTHPVSAQELRHLLLDRYQIGTIALGSEYLRIAYSSVDNAMLPELMDKVLISYQELLLRAKR